MILILALFTPFLIGVCILIILSHFFKGNKSEGILTFSNTYIILKQFENGYISNLRAIELLNDVVSEELKIRNNNAKDIVDSK